MTVRRASVILPCRSLADFPTHLKGDAAAELLAAWTGLWHPALIAATGALPGWHSADDVPDPTEFDAELVVVPPASQQHLATDWCDRLAATVPRNPPPVIALPSRDDTMAAALGAAQIDLAAVDAELVADFLALGHAHLQVELLTQSMRYSSVLDVEQFTSATVTASAAAIARNHDAAREELARAFDLLSDARNHVYSVDFYVVDVTLLARTTLGESLRSKLALGSPTSVLASGELLEVMAREQPESLRELRSAIEAGSACVIGGTYHNNSSALQSPEALLTEFVRGYQVTVDLLGRAIEVFAQFGADVAPLLPQTLKQFGFRGALHTAFDGTRLPKAEQRKTWWGTGQDASIAALAAVPLDVSRPETWLRLAAVIGDTIAHDHVATVLLAGWPGTHCDYLDDLRRAARFGTVLGKLITLDEYFRATREPDEWTTFYPREYPLRLDQRLDPDLISSNMNEQRRQDIEVYRHNAESLAAAAGLAAATSVEAEAARQAVVNPWNFGGPSYVGFDPLEFGRPTATDSSQAAGSLVLPEVPSCGYASYTAAAPPPPVLLAEKRTLRNDRLELTVNTSTGGIQSLRTHSDRNTRLSQRIVFQTSDATASSRMVADRTDVTRNDAACGEITSQGRLIGGGQTLAQFTQTVRLVRRLPVAIVDVELRPSRIPEGKVWESYFASRLAWSEELIAVRRGVQSTARDIPIQHDKEPAYAERIVSTEWVEVDDSVGTVTCFPLGLPFHRVASPTWLDTLLPVSNEGRVRYQFALGIDERRPTQIALGILTCGKPFTVEFGTAPKSPAGWFLHVGATNVVVTRMELLSPPTVGVRMRLLEIDGKQTRTRLTAFCPIKAAHITDFRGNRTDVLSVNEGRAEVEIGPFGWIQIEAEW